MKSIRITAAALLLAFGAVMSVGAPAEARTHKPHLSRLHTPRPHKARASKSAYRTVRIKRADGTVMTGYRDAAGTHLHGPDGRMIHCNRQTVGAADIDVACR